MDWEQLRERTLGEVGTTLVAEGAGVTAGFIGAAIVGRQIQNRVKTDAAVELDPTVTNKIMAWSANNVPKIAMWYLLKKYTAVEPGEVLTPMKEATVDAKKAISGSIIYDTIIRLANGGRNPGDVKLWGYQIMEPHKSVQSTSQADIQRLIQENSALRAELNKALQRLATPVQQPLPAAPVAQPAPQMAAPPPVYAAPVVQVQHPQVFQQAPPPVIRYQPVTPPVVYQPVTPPVVSYTPSAVRSEDIAATQPATQEKERKYGFMRFEQEPPAIQEREKKFGFMTGGEKEVAAMFGML